MEDTRSDFEKSLDPDFKPGPSAIIQAPEVKLGVMEGEEGEVNHHTRMNFVVTFKNRYQALECWSAVKTILETFQVPPQTQGVMMETLTCLAEHIDMDVKKEGIEKGLFPAEEAKDVSEGESGNSEPEALPEASEGVGNGEQ